MNIDESERLETVLGMASCHLLALDERHANALRTLLSQEVQGDPSFGDDEAHVEKVIEKLMRRVGQIFAVVDKPAADPEMAAMASPVKRPVSTRPAKELGFAKRR